MGASIEATEQSGRDSVVAVGIALAGWLIPGLGQLVQRRWGRAIVYFLAVGALAGTGIFLRGNIFTTWAGDAFNALGYAADLGAGGFYIVARALELGAGDVSRAAGDYGTRFFAAAGVLNVICALEAYEIARGKKA